MVFSCVILVFYAAHSRFIISYHNKQILNNKTVFDDLIYNFYMGQTLLICTDFVLAFYN